MLAAGLEGMDKKYELPDPVEKDIFHMSDQEKLDEGIYSLPGNLYDAVKLTEKSELVRNTLGDHIFEFFIKNKKIEWDQWRLNVSKWEIDRYLPLL